MAETYHEDMLAHMYEVQRQVTDGINAVLELARNGDKYLLEERDKLVALAKSSCPESPCEVADNYQGNPRPVV